MNYKAELYRKCHKELTELYDKRQIPLFNVDNEVKNILIQDGAIRRNGLDGLITTKGEDLFKNKHYLVLAEEAEEKGREKELRERDSLMNQLSVEKADEQNKINRQMLNYQRITLLFSGIAAIGTIFSLIKGCY
ncbi:MAG: hypothetical protein IKX61_01150 [Prevotella sp.]|nr:hypothetical protein [Prevotella sp.]